jgi:hypothetical protein
MSKGQDNDTPPAPEQDDRPWEALGVSRRDCEHHRAGLLMALAHVSIFAGVFSIPCCLPGLIGLAVGLIVRAMARRDMALIRAGHMDHRGYERTECARDDARIGMAFSLFGVLLWTFSIGFLMFASL